MSFDLGLLALIIVLYLTALFAVAFLTEKGVIPRSVARHPLTYILSLGVYTGVWAFYGSVAFASQYGYGFLFYYLGISAAFLLAPIFLNPLIQIAKSYQLKSLADILAFRYRSTWAGGLTALLLLIGLLPLLAAQIQAISDIIHVLSFQSYSQERPRYTQDQLTALFCIITTDVDIK